MAAATLSQRISFSHDLDLSPTATTAANNAPRRLDASLMLTSPSSSSSSSSDFDFSTSHEISAAPADELFAHGMLLPLSSINRQNIQNEPEKIKRPDSPKTLNLNRSSSPPSMNTKPPPPPSSPSFWANIRRSSSVGTVSKSRPASICPFPRSKSTGSYPNPNPNQSQKMRNSSKRSQSQNPSQSQSQNRNEKSWYNYYYSRSSKRSSHGNGVRINPVINVPAHFIPRGGSSGGSSGGDSGGKSGGGGGGGGGGNSFFAYLLCNCSKELGNYSP